MSYLRNYWYVAEYPENVSRKLTRRVLLGQPVVLYRREDGAPVALHDVCPHRRLPLSAGRLIGDTVQCGYHGLEFDCSGTCIRIPGEEAAPPKSYAVHSYPVLERHGYVWIWLGEPRLADPALLPDYARLGDPAWGKVRAHFRLECNHLLVVDNLMDLSHAAYVHNTTSGNPPLAEQGGVKSERDGNRARLIRTARNIQPPATFAKFGGYTGNIDLWIVSEFIAPAYIVVRYGSVPAGQGIPEGDAILSTGRWGFQVYHGITPETEKTTHHLRYVVYPHDAARPVDHAQFAREMDVIVNEDAAIYAVQQRAIDSDPEAPSAWDMKTRAPLDADGGLFHARAILRQLSRQSNIAKETSHDVA